LQLDAGEWRAQLVRGVGDELPLADQHAAKAHQQGVHRRHQRAHLADETCLRQVVAVGRCAARQRRGQVFQRAQAALDGVAHQEDDQQQLHQLQTRDRPLDMRAEVVAPVQRLADLDYYFLAVGAVHRQACHRHAQRLGLPAGVVVVNAVAETRRSRWRRQARGASEQLASFGRHRVHDAILAVLLQHVAQRWREFERQVAVVAADLRRQVERRVEQRMVVADRHEALSGIVDGTGAGGPYHHEAAQQVALQLAAKAAGLTHRSAPPPRSPGRGWHGC
jgi:hypothetical protein